MKEQDIIIAKELTKKFGNFTAVNKLNFSVKKGEIFGFLGANGAGKTTTIKMLTGLIKPSSGIANIAGYNIYTQTEEIKKNIGYMSQKFTLYQDLTVFENFRFYGTIYGMDKKIISKKANELLEQLNLTEHKNSIVKSLPLGWKQKLAFSLAIFHNPQIVFLDEPTSGVDPITRRMFWEYIYQTATKGITIFVTTHYMDEAEYCDRVTIMVRGKIAAIDTPENLKKQYKAQNLDQVFIKIVKQQG